MSKFHRGAKTWTLRRMWAQSEGSTEGTDERREGEKLIWNFWPFSFFFSI